MHDFHYFDHVKFVGTYADVLRSQGRCTTGVVSVTPESDPCVEVELDIVENSGQGGGTIIRLCEPNAYIQLSELGHKLRRIKSYRRHRDEQNSRPPEQRNPSIVARVEAFLKKHDHGQQVPLFC